MLLGLLLPLLAAQAVCLRLARSKAGRMMRPGELWDAEDLDRWLELIEPFPFEDVSNARD